MSKRILLTAMVLTAAATVTGAQQQQPPVFRSGVNLVTLDVTVVDKDGKPVRGLKASDFEVKLEGQVRPVQTVDFVESGSGSAVASAVRPGAPSNAPAPAKREPRAVVVLFDDLSFRPGRGKPLMVAAQRAIEQFGPDDLIGTTVTSGLVRPVNPTTDRVALKAAIGKVAGIAEVNMTSPFYISESEAVGIDRDDRVAGGVAARECPEIGMTIEQCQPMIAAMGRAFATTLRNRAAVQMDAFRQIITAMKQFRGEKVLIVASEGVSTMADIGAIDRQLEPIMREAAESGIRFYSLSEEPDYSDASSNGFERQKAAILAARDLFDGIASVAIAAGGEAFHVVGQADRFFTRIEAETSAIYRLGVDGPAGVDKARFLNAKVSVKTPGVTVRANRKALFADAPKEVIPIDKQLMNAVAGGFVDVAVPVTVATVLRRDAQSSQLQLGVNLQIPPDVPGPVTMMFSLMDEAGKPLPGLAGRKQLTPPAPGQDYRFSFALPLAAAGRYSMRVSAADANGKVGATEQRVDAQLGKIGAFSASSMLIGWSAADGVQKLLALDTLPPEAANMQVSLELYPDDAAGMATDVAVNLSITKIGDAKPVIEKQIRPSATGMVLSSAVDVDVKTLTPGTYSVKATVVQSGKEIGTVTGLVRKQ